MIHVPGIVLHPTAQAQLDATMAAPSHALLLSGPKGTGKTHVARAVAAALLATPVEQLEAHAYFRVVAPEKGSVSIEQIRTLIGSFRLKVPGKARVKRVAIIEDADTMGHEAQNALLKLLEEPPADSVLILTSSQPHSLLATIRSRAQHLHLSGPDIKQLQEHFTEAGYQPAAISTALLRSDTDVAAATLLLAAGDAPDTSVDLVKQALGGTSYDRLLLVDSLSKQKDAATAFADTLTTVAMASLQAAANKGAKSLDRWKDVLQAAHTAQEAFARSGNAKLVLTELMLSL